MIFLQNTASYNDLLVERPLDGEGRVVVERFVVERLDREERRRVLNLDKRAAIVHPNSSADVRVSMAAGLVEEGLEVLF